jgi:prepilin-type N-terminal cleavage/methylation domain-containing protein
VNRLRRGDAERGFTLVEMMAAILVFSLITLGLVPLLLTSMRAASLSRSRTVGKNLVQQAMERARGLPYYSPVNDPVDPRREDVLDLYYPNMGPGYSAGTFTTTCTATVSTPSPSADSACPPENTDGTPRIPPGYTITFAAQFVQPVEGSNPQTFSVVVPTDYDWDDPATESPRSELLRMTITATWTLGDTPQSFQLASLLSGGDVSPDRMRGNATTEYTVEVDASYLDTAGRRSTLSARVGRNVASVEERAFVVADQEIEAGRLTLLRDQTATEAGVTLASGVGVTAALHAPPNLNPAPGSTAPELVVSHADVVRMADGSSLTEIAALDDTAVTSSGTGVQVVNELPSAQGAFDFPAASGTDLLWVRNQVDPASPLRLANVPMVTLEHATPNRVKGSTSALGTALVPSGSRKVETSAHAEFGTLSLLPTDFAPDGVVRITNFSADILCRATGTAATAEATGSWAATLTYFQDSDPEEGVTGSYVTVAGFNGSTSATGVDPLVALKAANPIVLDAPEGEPDLHLFDKPGQQGYLTDFTSLKTLTRSTSAATASVTIPQTFALQTAVTDPGNPASFLGVRAAQMSCEAVDRRG